LNESILDRRFGDGQAFERRQAAERLAHDVQRCEGKFAAVYDTAGNCPPVRRGEMRLVWVPDNPQASCAGSRDASQYGVVAPSMDKYGICLWDGIDATGNPLYGSGRNTGFDGPAGDPGQPQRVGATNSARDVQRINNTSHECMLPVQRVPTHAACAAMWTTGWRRDGAVQSAGTVPTHPALGSLRRDAHDKSEA